MSTIAFDARKLADFGIGSYVAGLAAALGPALPGDELVLLGDRTSIAGTDSPLLRNRWLHDDSPRYSLRELWSLSRSAGRAFADLLHVPHYTLPFRPPCPVVVTVHDLVHLRFPEHRTPLHSAYARWMFGRAVHRSAALLAVSEATKRELVERFGPAAERAVVVPNGIDARFFAPVSREAMDRLTARLGVSPGYLLFVGNPMPHKNLAGLLAAYARLRRELPEVPTLVLAGDRGGARSPLPSMVARAGVADAVRLAGHLAADELPALYAAARLLVVPSLWEGFGLPAAEAMACGTPVAVADRGGLPEVVGDAGERFDPSSSRAIAAAIAGVLADGARRAEMARRGRELARRFRWPESASQVAAVYRSVLGRRERTR